MNDIRIRLADIVKNTIPIGYEGEENHTRVLFYCSAVFDEYPDAVATMAIKPAVGDAYPQTVTQENGLVVWDVTPANVAGAGSGTFQFTFTEGEEIIKSVIGSYTVSASIIGSGEMPDPVADWVTEANAALAAIPNTISEAIDDALEEAKESGDFKGDPGEPGAKGDKGDPGDPAPASAVAAAVDDYLEENFSNPSNPPLDRSLTSSLSAAPADLVGDLKNAIEHINPSMTDFMVQGKNLFIPYTLKKGIIISTSTHKETENVNYYTSDYIPVTGGTEYIIRYMSYIHYYDTGKNWVSLDSNTYQNNYAFTPAQDGYIRFSNNIQSAPNLKNTLNNIVAKSDEYYVEMPYEYELDEHYVGLDDDIHPINLIASIENGYIRRTDGVLVSPTGQYRSSNLIKIDPDKSYYWYNLRPDFGGFYNKFGQYIATTGSLANPFKPSDYVTGAVFVRVSGYNNQIGLYERPISKYIPVGEKVFDESLVNLNAPVKLDVFLPPDFYVTAGRTIEIFNETLISTPSAEGFSFRWTSTVGTNYKRKFVFSAASVGDYTVNLRIYDRWFNIVFDGNTTIHVVPALALQKTIVPIGDSLTNGKPWLRYIADLQTNGITFTGTRWHDTGTSISAAIKHEGRSGWRASHYTGNNSYTFDSDGVSSANPFYDTENNTFSWNYYKSQYDISADGVQFFLGTNGLSLAPQAEENALVNMVNKIRSEDANIPIFVCYPIHTADQNGCARQANSDGYSAAQGMFYAEKKLAMWNFIQRLYTRLKDTSGVYFVPVCQNFDHEYMFGITDVPVNQYSEITEPMPTEGVHPRDYHQFTDPMYGAYCYAFGT